MLDHFEKDNKQNNNPISEDQQSSRSESQPFSSSENWSGKDSRKEKDTYQQTGQTPPPYSSSYPPPPHYNNFYRGYGSPNPQNNKQSYQYNPYQYNANSGWQHEPKKQEKYEWNFEDYDQFNRKKDKKKKSRGLVVFAVSILCVLSVGLVAFSGYSIWTYFVNPDNSGTEAGQDAASSIDAADQLEITAKPKISSAPTVGEDGKMSIPEVAERVSPSVVGVIQYQNSMRFYEEAGMGSGIIMNEEGYIITNAHVVKGGIAYKVELYNGDVYEAELVGADDMTDLAVLKINAENLVPAEFGDSNELRVGETVIAIGNPAGLELAGSVTRGIVSALNRKVETSNYSFTYIQTDAAINPGNSGGALVNEYGQVVGINSSKIVASGYEGIGFSIPVSDAKPIIDDILKNGHVTGRVMLGITCIPIDEVDARTYNIKMGLEIVEISPYSDLANKDVMKGDIITHLEGERIFTLSDVRNILNGRKAGDEITMTVYRKLSVTREVSFDVSFRLIEDEGKPFNEVK